MRRALALLFVSAAPVACAPSLIPGTEIRDSDENRQILAVFSAYRAALEARSVDRIMKLVHPSFFDDSGTPDGRDDFDYKGLNAKLATWVEKTRSVRANLQVKQIEVKENLATVKYFYELNYEILGPDGAPAWRHDSDSKETTLRRVDGRWMIIRGL